MIGLRLYAAPLANGAVLVATPSALSDLGGAGHLLRSHPQPVRVEVLAPDTSLDVAALREPALTLVRRAAVMATLPSERGRARTDVGPRGRWYAALVTWGWLLLLAAGQSALQVVGGVWMAIGLPWVRSRYRRAASVQRGAAEWLAAALRDADVIALPHGGLAILRDAIATAPPEAATRTAHAACLAAGLTELMPWYAALAADEVPPGLWAYVIGSGTGEHPTSAAGAEGAGECRMSRWVASP